ncbi:MAG TPA: hypothetical protein ENK57_03965 [Polyangiaceae bacterium]|nr:hypothetical protein [Polyangiaceae bacterium]
MSRWCEALAAWMTLGAGASWALGASGCNAITGADAIVLDGADDDDAGDGAGADDTGAVAVGAGGQTSGPVGPAGVGGAGEGVGAGPASTGVGGTGTGAPGPTECEYPAGPYGVAQGQIVPPNLTWQGFAPGSSTPETISIQDFFDCDGSRGINAVLFDTSQFG